MMVPAAAPQGALSAPQAADFDAAKAMDADDFEASTCEADEQLYERTAGQAR
jgi:hypothetical protein